MINDQTPYKTAEIIRDTWPGIYMKRKDQFEFYEDKINPDKLKLFMDLYQNGPVDERGNVNFYWCPHSTSKKFPQFSHVMLQRGQTEPISPWFFYFSNIVQEFLIKQKIKFGQPIRACLNLCYHIPGHEYFDPHIDYHDKHYVIILYLNESDGNTVIFKNEIKSKKSKSVIEYSDVIGIKHEVSPEVGKIICFDGKHYHALRSPSPGKVRLACVFNVTKITP